MARSSPGKFVFEKSVVFRSILQPFIVAAGGVRFNAVDSSPRQSRLDSKLPVGHNHVRQAFQPDICILKGLAFQPDICILKGLAFQPDICILKGLVFQPDICTLKGLAFQPDICILKGLAFQPDICRPPVGLSK
jgi:hypothetical protein